MEPAEIDHLDLTLAEGQLRRLCRACAEAERQRWDAERIGAPRGPGSRPQPSSQAA